MLKIGTLPVSAALALSICLTAAGEDRVRFDDHSVARVEVDSMRELRTLLALGGDIWSE